MMQPDPGDDPWDDEPIATAPPIHELLDHVVRSTPDQRAALIAASGPWARVLERLAHGPDPEGALRHASRLPSAFFDAQAFPSWVATMLHQGGYWARLLGTANLTPHELDAVCTQSPGAADEIRQRLLAEPDIPDALGRWRTHEYLRLAVREVDGAPLEEVGRDLSDLASLCIEAALHSIDPDLSHQVVVFGMGKLGGRELNFLSDIDLVFVHEDAAYWDEQPNKTRLHGQLRRLVAALEGESRWGPLFRVDLRLRPFGARGPIVMSASAMEAYYERYGRPWERQAWLRARPVAGRLDVGVELLQRLTPFVYRRSVSPAIFDEVSQLMLRARREARTGLDDLAVDVKLDSGGIREVEFFVQALQLLHGGKVPQLRTSSTLDGLDRLLAQGLLTDREHRHLVRGYRWLRRVEHRLQLVEGRRTHRIPESETERRLLAARLYDSPDTSSPDQSLAAFVADLHEHRTRIAVIAQTLHGPSKEHAVTQAERERARAHDAILDPGARTEVRLQALESLGVRDPVDADAALQHLYSRPTGAFAGAGASRTGAERLLVACLDSVDPDAALQRLATFAARRPEHHAIWRLFGDDGAEQAELVRLCAELMASSTALSDGLMGFPGDHEFSRDDSIALLLEARSLRSTPSEQSIREDLADLPPDPRGLDATLLRFKQREIVRLALHDLGRRPSPLEIGRALAGVADPIIEALVRDQAMEDDLHAPAFDLAVFALGKYGMQAMDYGSDLDLMFVYTEGKDGSAPVRARATRHAQRLIARLQDRRYGARLYEVDARLRPSGRQGLLVTSMTGFRHYHAHPLPVWERLALLWLRPVVEVRFPGGTSDSRTIGQEIASDVMPASLRAPFRAGASPHDAPAEVARQVRQLKVRIEEELARETRNSFHAKSGHGACLELELLVSALYLIGAAAGPMEPVGGILEALTRLREAAILPPEDARTLAEIYRFQRLLLNRLRMAAGGRADDPDRFSVNSPRLGALARRMGLPDSETLIKTYLEYRSMVRSAFDRYLPANR